MSGQNSHCRPLTPSPSSFQELSPPLVDDFLYLCDDAYNREQMLAMERDVLRVVDYDINAPVTYRFIRRLARVGGGGGGRGGREGESEGRRERKGQRMGGIAGGRKWLSACHCSSLPPHAGCICLHGDTHDGSLHQ